MNKSTPSTPALLLGLSLIFSAALPAAAQRREHLTPEEIEQVRDNQELDKRTAVFIKAAQRRVLALTDPAGAAREAEKEKEQWGEVKGTRAQLLYDVARILDEAVVNIDDAHQRSPESALLRKSLYRLSEAAARLVPQLTPLRESIKDEPERDQLERAIETAREIVEAAKTHAVTEEDLKTKEKGGKKGN
ncbi:MAG: hypothetical protein M3416_07085 [Acidobacteriota bacterium]|nr:hypothetical protein [Acidobacteriota bacterium]